MFTGMVAIVYGFCASACAWYGITTLIDKKMWKEIDAKHEALSRPDGSIAVDDFFNTIDEVEKKWSWWPRKRYEEESK